MQDTKRNQYLKRWAQLESERSSWISHWTEISEYLLPRSGRFVASERNKGKKKHNNIYDSTATKALRTLGAGLMAGMTSPARPWFRLSTPDLDLNEAEPVKLWLNKVTIMMREIFNRSNTYRSLHTVYEELGAFGTGASLIVDNYENVIHQHPMTIGEYALAADYNGKVDTFYREFDMTVAQLVKEFGKENCSKNVQTLYDRGNLDQWITVIHVIEPRADRDYGKKDAKNMPFASCYFESGSDEDKWLRESGFEEFPIIAPRWALLGGDVYGSSPGMEALGDIKQLQHEQLRKAEGIDYMTKPPLQVPMALRNADFDVLPGGISYVDASGQGAGIRSAFDVNLRLDYLLSDIQDVRQRIQGTFFADLFMMIANDTRSNITAREIAERHEEKLLMLGPVLERLHNEMLDPLIDVTFSKMVKSGILPPPPPELQGVDLKVEFVSMLAQAQRAVGTAAVDRLLGTVGAMAQFKPDVLDKIDHDQLVDNYADMLGVDPSLIVADDKVAIVRQQRAQAQQQMMQQEQAAQAAATAKTMSETDTESQGTALSDVTRLFTGL